MIPINTHKFFTVIEKKTMGKTSSFPKIMDYVETKPDPKSIDIQTRTILKKEDFLQENADTYIKIMSFLNSQYQLEGVLFEEPQQTVLDKFVKRFSKKDTRSKFSFSTHIIVVQEIKFKK